MEDNTDEFGVVPQFIIRCNLCGVDYLDEDVGKDCKYGDCNGEIVGATEEEYNNPYDPER